MLTIRVINPDEDRKVVKAFMACQSRTYAEFGTEKASRDVTSDEIDEGDVYFVVAEEKHTEALVGGLRFHLRRTGSKKLLIETLMETDPRLQAYSVLQENIERWAARGLAEISGLWADGDWRGTGLSAAMVSAALAAMPLFGVRRSIAFTHHHVLKTWRPLGWREDSEVRSIPYPDPRYESSIIWNNPPHLNDAEDTARRQIFHMRDTLKRGARINWPPKNNPRSLQLVEAHRA